MVKYIGVADDIIAGNTGRRVDATRFNVPFKFDDLDVELDLADETYAQIRELVMPIFAAHAAATGIQQPGMQQPVSSNTTKALPAGAIVITPEMRQTNGRKYKAACRVWAKKVGRLAEINRYYYPVGLLDDFDAYLIKHKGAVTA